MEYDPKKDYCGPGRGGILTKIIPRKIFGVDFNSACYRHDRGYATGTSRKQEDQRFLMDMKQMIYTKVPRNGIKRKILLVIARIYYIKVRMWGWLFYRGKDEGAK